MYEELSFIDRCPIKDLGEFFVEEVFNTEEIAKLNIHKGRVKNFHIFDSDRILSLASVASKCFKVIM
ncbi:LOW QUALITY PROTEIN: hypothetical protein KUTeg_011349, partial [Tegillarca granosa]